MMNIRKVIRYRILDLAEGDAPYFLLRKKVGKENFHPWGCL